MRTRAVAVVATALLLLLVGGTADAATAPPRSRVVVKDPARDMWRMDFAGRTERSPDTRLGDVRTAVFRHGRFNVVIRQRYVDLRRVGAYASYTARVQNGAKSRYREVQVQAGRHRWRGTVKVFNRRGDRVKCAAKHTIDYDRNTVVITVPRSCLGTPKYVRATASSSWAHRGQQAFFLDNPHNTRSSTNAWTRWLRTG